MNNMKDVTEIINQNAESVTEIRSKKFKSGRGGKRSNAGRPKSEATKVVRLPLSVIEKLNNLQSESESVKLHESEDVIRLREDNEVLKKQFSEIQKICHVFFKQMNELKGGKDDKEFLKTNSRWTQGLRILRSLETVIDMNQTTIF